MITTDRQTQWSELATRLMTEVNSVITEWIQVTDDSEKARVLHRMADLVGLVAELAKAARTPNEIATALVLSSALICASNAGDDNACST